MSASEDCQSRLKKLIERASELLPSQGPITSFVFLNTLQGLEDLPFDEGMKKGARLFGCQPYLPEDQYRQKMSQGRIRHEDLYAVLREDLGPKGEEIVCGLTTRRELRLAMLQFPLRMGPTSELRWFVEETNALTKVRDDAPHDTRERLIGETRHWVMRDLRGSGEQKSGRSTSRLEHRVLLAMANLLDQFGVAKIEGWSDATWENFSLRALWRVCRDGVHAAGPAAATAHHPIRHRDWLFEATGEDSDALVHPLLIRFCAAFLDQGFADWRLPGREQGFFRAFVALYAQPLGPPEPWQHGLAAELNRLAKANASPLESLVESLVALGVAEEEWEDFVVATLLALRGWAGMICQNEVRGDRVALPAPAGSLVEFLAVRLILERLALGWIGQRSLNHHGPLSELREAARVATPKHEPTGIDQRAFLLFQLSQVLGWTPPSLYRLSREQWNCLVAEIESFHSLERRRLFHLAFERRLHTMALDAIAIRAAQHPPERVPSPRFQACFCIDAREESFRRHLEEFAPDTETFGNAGFYCVPIYYRGLADAHFVTLCPIVVRPQYWLTEEIVIPLEELHRRRAATRKALGTASRRIHFGSRSIAAGALLTVGLGVLASIPLVARVLFPRLTARFSRTASEFVAPPAVTRLRLERSHPVPGPNEDQIGFTVDEMANMAERNLRDIGLLTNFARLVFLFGHGSFCLNNPHKSAYDCGACSGGAGGPNARALAAMLNDRRVREILAKRGLPIPDSTYFVGGLHNTCNDSILYYDLDLLPQSHFHDFLKARDTLDQVCDRNAHERCRRFESAPLNLSFDAARRHVEGRAEDLAETRPEYGNASNAMCFVGRRSRTRGLYLDRRSFLQSYDPTQDDAECTILGRILGAVVPVCEGINMQYTLSAIDNNGWGCGTKLPHNIVSLLGVMDGAASDLRPGIPFQGVEIHEPVRCLFIIETTPRGILQIMGRNELVGKILRNGWAKLALLDPETSRLSIYRNGVFHPYEPLTAQLPQAPSSLEWYRGWRDHLEFAAIDSGTLVDESH